MYNRSLAADMRSETSGKFKDALIMNGALTRAEAYADVCNKAIRGFGTDEKSLIRILTTASFQDIQDLNQAYTLKYGNLQHDLAGDTSGSFKRILMALSKRRVTDGANSFDPSADADVLRNACEGFGTDENAIILTLGNKNESQISLIRQAYQQKYGEDLKTRLKSETTGLFESEDFRECLVSLCDSRTTAIAKYIREAMKGWGTDNWGLIMLLVHRSEGEKQNIRIAYADLYQRDLVADLKEECTGDFEDCLVALVEPVASTFATAIQKSVGFFSTADDTLIAMLIASTSFMEDVRSSFEHKYNKALVEFLREKESGDYGKILVALASYTSNKFELRI